MPIVHYLNVKEGDCSIIQHGSGRISVIDVCNARDPDAPGIATALSPLRSILCPVHFPQRADLENQSKEIRI